MLGIMNIQMLSAMSEMMRTPVNRMNRQRIKNILGALPLRLMARLESVNKGAWHSADCSGDLGEN